MKYMKDKAAQKDQRSVSASVPKVAIPPSRGLRSKAGTKRSAPPEDTIANGNFKEVHHLQPSKIAEDNSNQSNHDNGTDPRREEHTTLEEVAYDCRLAAIGQNLQHDDLNVGAPSLSRSRACQGESTPGAFPQRPFGAAASSGFSIDDNFATTNSSCPMTAYHDHGLVHARPVSVLPTGTVEPFDEERANRRNFEQKKSLFYLLVPWALCVIVLVTVGLIVFLTAGNDTTAAPSPLMPGSNDTNNANDETPVVGWTWDLPFSLPNYTLHTLKYDTNYTKPQSKAYLWMKNDPNLHNYTEERLIQRFAMATFYYATVGEEWTHQGGGTVTVTADAAGRPGGRRQLQPPGGGSGGLKEVNITSEPWLSYNASECTWLSSSPLRKKEACNENHTLENLELLGNGLAGTLPEELGLLTSLTYIKLGNIGGTIISQFGSLPKLWGLHLFGSRLTGTIPSELGLLSNTLKGFAVQGNFLSGSLPSEFWQLRELKELRIANNPLELSIPNGMHKYMPKFRVLYAARLATLDGSLPTTLGLLTGLSHFNIEENAVTGPLPSELATLTKLGSIIASNNQLTGSLPSEYGLFQSLESLDLRGNMGMVGPFSPELANLNDTLEVLDLQDTSITGTVPEELCGLESLSFACSPRLCGCDCTCMEL